MSSKEYYVNKIAKIQQGIDHYKNRLKSAEAEVKALNEALRKKEEVHAQRQAEYMKFLSTQVIKIMTPEEETAFNAKVAEDAARRQRE